MDNTITAKITVPVNHIFDVDQKTGFMASEPPLERLPAPWEAWEAILDVAIRTKLQLGDNPGISMQEMEISRVWRVQVSKLPAICVEGLSTPILLRRAHLVLTFLLHFYVQSLPPHENVIVPRSIAIPVLRVSNILDIPPVLTFSDTVLYNWDFRTPSVVLPPALDNIRTQTMFSSLVDEEEFYLCSARIELRGVEALELMRVTMDETFVGDAIAVRRISGYLQTIAGVIDEMKALLMDVRKLCDPDTYYNQVRPWFRGEDSDINKRKWVYEGVEDDNQLKHPTELSGPSAGQSSLVHVLDLFLGVDHQSASPGKPSFMLRMQTYMPHNHRMFLTHLAANPRPLRAFVIEKSDGPLSAAYNRVVQSLKEFRDSHMIIATLYILGPARKAAKVRATLEEESLASLKGTGGTDLVKFLKDTRTRTSEALIR